MKTRQLLPAVAAVLCLSATTMTLNSCTEKDDVLPAPGEARLLNLSSSIVSRAGESAWTAGDAVGIYMNDPATAAIVNGVDNKKYATPAGDGLFAPENGPDYYPVTGEEVHITAYYPWSAGIEAMQYPIDITDQSDPEKIDLMHSNNLRSVAPSDEARQLVFNHRLSKVILNLKPGGDLTAGHLAGATVKLADVPRTATFDIATGAINSLGGNGGLTGRTSAAGDRSELILLPGDHAGKQLEITLSGGLSFFCKLPSNALLEGGKKYAYDITVTASSAVLEGSGIIEPWAPGEGGELEATVPETAPTYAVGDYYPDADDASTAIGVVFWLDSPRDGKSSAGRIVSLTQTWGAWGPYQAETEAARGVEGIDSKTDGETGTRNLIALRSGQQDFATAYKAFAWIYGLNGNDVDGRWYMPAKEELQLLKDWFNTDRAAADALFTAAGGAKLIVSGSTAAYWTSTETASDKAHHINMGNTNSMSAMKNLGLSVRAISKF